MKLLYNYKNSVYGIFFIISIFFQWFQTYPLAEYQVLNFFFFLNIHIYMYLDNFHSFFKYPTMDEFKPQKVCTY